MIWMQQQNYSLEALAERDRNDPFAAPAAPPISDDPPPEDDEIERFVATLTKALEAA